MGWSGKSVRITPANAASVRLFPGDVVVRQARPLHAGLCEGSSDLIGLKRVVITPDMVGQTIAQFLAIEVKTPKGKPKPKQNNFLDVVNGAGGIGMVARSVDDLDPLR